MWQNYFKFVNLVPGKVVVPRHGTIDFSNPNIPLQTIQELYESDFPYLQITQQGLEELYGITPKPQTTNHKPETINPKPSTRKRKSKK